jgi:hypothetical protein
MDKTKAFSLSRPWYGILSGGHVPEMFKATVSDAFGLRERVTCCFAEPAFSSIGFIRTACSLLPVKTGKPADFVAKLFLPLFRWSIGRKEANVFTASAEDGALHMVDDKFDGHMQEQKQSFLKHGEHQKSKYHGKLRTKFDRMALSMHVANTACEWLRRAAFTSPNPAGFNIDGDWCPLFTVDEVICQNVLKLTYMLAEHCEDCWKIFRFRKGWP